MRTIAALLATISLAAAAPAPARADAESGLALGLRAAYAVPFGSAVQGTNLNQLTSGSSPLQLDVGWRFDRRWQAGGYLGYGFVRLADEANAALAAQGATDVDGHALMRLGVQGIYTILPDARFAPWVGASVGYEWLRYASATVAGKETEVGVRGFEAGVQVGADYRLGASFTVGPFAAFSVGQFSSRMTWVSGSGETATDVTDKGLHEWLQLGFKGSFEL
jgi:outer membrane protein W